MVLAPLSFAAETTYQLKPFPQQPGQVVTIRSSSKSTDGKVIVQRGDSKTEGAMSIQRTRHIEQRLVTSGGAAGIAFKVLEDSSVATDELEAPGKRIRQTAALTGETVEGFQDTFRRWHLYLKGKTANNRAAVELSELEAYANRRWFVNGPVRIGQSWPAEPAFIRHLVLRDLGDAELKATMTLEAVKDIGGLRTAVVACKLETVGARGKSGDEPAATATINATGKVHITLATMLDRELVLNGTLQSTGRNGDNLTTAVLPFTIRMTKTVAKR